MLKVTKNGKSENAKPLEYKWAINVIYSQSSLKYSVYSSLPLSPAAPVRLIRSSRAALRLSPWRGKWTICAFSDIVKPLQSFELPENRIHTFEKIEKMQNFFIFTFSTIKDGFDTPAAKYFWYSLFKQNDFFSKNEHKNTLLTGCPVKRVHINFRYPFFIPYC